MHSQWTALLKNLGEWQGSFTRLSPLGEILEDTPSVVALEGLDNNQKIRQTICLGGSEKVLEYSTLARSVLFFDNGAFSQGSIQLAPFSEFGAEFGLIYENQRLRLVQLFDKNLQLDKLTLIREHLAGTQPPQKPPFTVDDLLGEWQGEAVTIYPDWRSPDSFSTKMQLQIDGNGRLTQNLTFGDVLRQDASRLRTISSTATIKNSIIHFDQDPQKQVQVLLLPEGASATSPLKLSVRQPFFLEVGWLIQPGLRQRMIRSYSDKGDWISLTLVTEKKI